MENNGTFVLIYSFFYPFNRRVIYSSDYTFGDHVGDIEQVKISFRNWLPTHVYFASHDFDDIVYKYATEGFVEPEENTVPKTFWRNPIASPDEMKLEFFHSRPVLYAARGNHGFYPQPRNYSYFEIPGLIQLVDECAEGTLWDVSQSIRLVSVCQWLGVSDLPFHDRKGRVLPWASKLNLQNWALDVYRWGNPPEGCWVGWINLNRMINTCKLNSGPVGFALKSPMRFI